MNKIPHDLDWLTTSDNYLEDKLYAWYVNPYDVQEQYIIFELYENEFYLIKSCKGRFKTNNRNCIYFTEKEAKKKISILKKKNMHCIVNWWEDEYCSKNLNNVKDNDLHDLVIDDSGGISGYLEIKLYKKSNVQGKKPEKERVQLISKWLLCQRNSLTKNQILKMSEEDRLKWIRDRVNENEFKSFFQIFDKSRSLRVFYIHFNEVTSLFLYSIKDNQKSLYKYFVKNFNISTLDPMQCYDSFFIALKLYKQTGDEYFIKNLLKKLKEDKYSIKNSDLSIDLKRKIKEMVEKELKLYEHKYSKQILKSFM